MVEFKLQLITNTVMTVQCTVYNMRGNTVLVKCSPPKDNHLKTSIVTYSMMWQTLSQASISYPPFFPYLSPSGIVGLFLISVVWVNIVCYLQVLRLFS